MRGNTHLLYGTIAGVSITTIYYPEQYMFGVPLLVGAIIGSLAPDLDIKQSKIGKKLKPLSFVLSKLFGHRGLMHTPLFLFLIWLIYYIFTKHNLLFLNPFFFSFTVSYLFHLIQDTFTKGGISWFYPVWKKKLHIFNIKSGHYSEGYTSFCILLFIWLMCYEYLDINQLHQAIVRANLAFLIK